MQEQRARRTRISHIAKALERRNDFHFEPVALAKISESGKTLWYDCPHCGGTHRHRWLAGIKPGEVIGKLSHCPLRPDATQLIMLVGRLPARSLTARRLPNGRIKLDYSRV